jgi:hypothetical protein
MLCGPPIWLAGRSFVSIRFNLCMELRSSAFYRTGGRIVWPGGFCSCASHHYSCQYRSAELEEAGRDELARTRLLRQSGAVCSNPARHRPHHRGGHFRKPPRAPAPAARPSSPPRAPPLQLYGAWACSRKNASSVKAFLYAYGPLSLSHTTAARPRKVALHWRTTLPLEPRAPRSRRPLPPPLRPARAVAQ